MAHLVFGNLTVNGLRLAAGIWLVVALGLPIVRNVPDGHWPSNDMRAAGVSGESLMPASGIPAMSLESVGHPPQSHRTDLVHMPCCTISAFNLDDGTATSQGFLTLRDGHWWVDTPPVSRAIAPDPQPPRSV